MAAFPFTSLANLSVQVAQRPWLLYGLGSVAERTLAALPNTCCGAIATEAAGTPRCDVFCGRPMWSLADALQHQPRPVFVICASEIPVACGTLAKHGLSPGHDYVIAPELGHLAAGYTLETHAVRLLFCSGSVPNNDGSGGLYELNLAASQVECRRLHAGACHGITKVDGHYFVTDDQQGVLEFDEQVRFVQATRLPAHTRPHGIAYHAASERFYVAATARDSVLVLNRMLQPLAEYPVGIQGIATERAVHHVNDLVVLDNTLFVSLFSHSGYWRQSIFDGVLIALRLPTGTVHGPVLTGLQMPHSVHHNAGRLHVLNSGRGELWQGAGTIVTTCPGFARGYAWDGQYHYIAYGRNRLPWPCQQNGLQTIDTAIRLLDAPHQLFRDLVLPNHIPEVHALILR